MEISGVNSANQVSQDQNQEISQKNTLDKNAFFELLITQLKNQDPLKPMENKEFIAQMAQFSALEQMQNMNQNIEKFLNREKLTDGAVLIGKTVEKAGENEVISGEVKKVIFEDGNSYVTLEDGTRIRTDSITAIY